MVERRRLFDPDIEPRARQLALRKRRRQRRFVVDAAAADGDEIGRLLHLLEGGGAEHAACFVIQAASDENEIGSFEKIVETHQLGAPLRCLFACQPRMRRQHLHAEGDPADLRHARADLAETDDTERFAEDIVVHEIAAHPVPVAAQRLIHLCDLLGQRQHHADRMLRHGLRVHAGLIDDQHTGLGTIGDMNGVVASPPGRHRQQVRTAFDEGAVAAIRVPDVAPVASDLIAGGALQNSVDLRVRHGLFQPRQFDIAIPREGIFERLRIGQKIKIENMFLRHLISLPSQSP